MSPDDLLRAVLEHTMGEVREPLEAGLRRLADELSRQAASERDRAVHEAVERVSAEVRRDADARLAALHETAERRLAEARREAGEEIQQLESARRAVEAELAATRASAADEIAAVRRDGETQLAMLRQQAERQVLEVRERAAAEAAEARRKAAAELDDVRREAQSQLEDAQRASEERLAAARRDAESAQRAGEGARHLLEAQGLKIQDLQGRLTAAAAARQALVDGMRSLDEASALGDVLDRLVRLPRREDERVTVYVRRDDRLRQWRGSADHPALSPPLDVRLADAGILAGVVRTCRPQFGDGGASGVAARDERRHAAFPITVAGAVVAVLAVDHPPEAAATEHEPSEASWLAGYELLARHASRLLEAITVQRAAGLLPSAGFPSWGAGHPSEERRSP